MKKILSIALIGTSVIFGGCGGEKNQLVSTPVEKSAEASNATTQEMPVPKEATDWTGLSEKISALPSVGATRAEFEQNYPQTDADSVANITYGNEELIVQFMDERGDETESKTSRAVSVTVWPTEEKTFTPPDIDEIIPSDATNLEREDVQTDDTKIIKTVMGRSEQLAKIFPPSNGTFGGSFIWDKSTNKFLSGTIAVVFPPPNE